MWKKIIVIFMVLVSCYCLENNEQLTEEARAKKKKTPLRLLAMIALAVFSKVTIVKIVTFFFFFTFFQKLFYLGGILLNYYLKNQGSPNMVYGGPQDYNTVGYSYDIPDHEPFQTPDSLPSIADIGNGFNWLFKNPS